MKTDGDNSKIKRMMDSTEKLYDGWQCADQNGDKFVTITTQEASDILDFVGGLMKMTKDLVSKGGINVTLVVATDEDEDDKEE